MGPGLKALLFILNMDLKVQLQNLEEAQPQCGWKGQMDFMLKHHGALDIAQGLRTMPVMVNHADGAEAII